MRAMAQWGLLNEAANQTFSANAATRQLVRGEHATLGHFVDHQINKPKWDAWKNLPEAVRTGKVAFALAHDGLDMHEVSMPYMESCRAESVLLRMRALVFSSVQKPMWHH